MLPRPLLRRGLATEGGGGEPCSPPPPSHQVFRHALEDSQTVNDQMLYVVPGEVVEGRPDFQTVCPLGQPVRAVRRLGTAVVRGGVAVLVLEHEAPFREVNAMKFCSYAS